MNSEMGNFYREVVKAHGEHSDPGEFVTFHGPKSHGNHGEHCQLTFVNRVEGTAGKIRIPTDNCLG